MEIDALTEEMGRWAAFLPRLALAVAAILVAWLVGRLLARAVTLLLSRADLDLDRGFFRTLTKGVCLFIGLAVALNILGLEAVAVSLLAGGGITAVVLGFAFREIGENLLAGMFLAFSRPFNVGDLIESGGILGRVRGIFLRYTHIRTDDGRDVFVPSAQLVKEPLHNYTLDGLRRFDFVVGIDYANGAEAACGLLRDVARGAPGVLADPAADAIVSALLPTYVELKVFYWVNTNDADHPLGAVRNRVMDRCRAALLENGYTVSADTSSNITVRRAEDQGASGP